MRKLLLLIATVLLFGCAACSGPVLEGPPSSQEECEYGCLNVYSSCILECDKSREIGTQLDSCTEQCKQQWAECKEGCSEIGNLQ